MTESMHISPSQVATAGRCGWAYAHTYKHRIRPAKQAVPLLTGSVLHRALEKWSLDHDLDFPELVADAWLEELSDDPGMLRVIRAYQKLSKRSLTLQKEILERRPDIKVVSMTKDFKSSQVAKDLRKFIATNQATLLKADHNWAKSDFCNAYDETILCAQRYQEKYQDSPPAIRTEVQFTIDHEGLILKGVVDYLGLYISDDGEVLGYLILDAKSYGKHPHPLKDFIQLAVYRIAAEQQLPVWLEDVGMPFNPDWPIFVGIDMMKSLEHIIYHMTPEQLATATSILRAYDTFREVAPLLPNFKADCDRCEWFDDCNKSVALIRLEEEVA